MGSSDDQPTSNAQLVQAMVSFDSGGSAIDNSNTVSIGADTSQQPLLTTTQHT
jgi:hypothetical protein